MIAAPRAFVARLRASLGGRNAGHDFRAELESHLQHHVDDNVRAGMPPDEARRAAILKLGGVAQTLERHDDRRRLPLIDQVGQDVRYALRGFRRNPAFTAAAVLTLALGIGATTAIFSIVNAVLLRPLPFDDPERLVMIGAIGHGRSGSPQDVVSYPTFIDWRDRSRSLVSAAAYADVSLTVGVDGRSELLPGKRVTPGFFEVLGVRPAIGRLLRDDDDPHVVVLSDGFWRRQFGGAPDAIGRTLRLNDEAYTIVGVLAPAFRFEAPPREQLFVPIPIDTNRKHGFLRVVARLRDGATRAAANAELDAICEQLARIYPRIESRAASVVPLVDALAGPSRLALLLLFGAVLLLLLIACANVGGLLLARGAARRQEIAMRAALGAGRGRLVRQLLTESLLVALGGAVAGLLVADRLARALVAAVGTTASVPRLDMVHTDGRALSFAVLLSLAAGTLFGILPAWSVSAADPTQSLRDGSRMSSGRSPRIRAALVVAQTALALVLLATAGVLMRTLLSMRATHPGFDTHNILAVDLWLPPKRFAKVADRAAFVDRTLSRMRALPGVRGAAFVADLPLNGGTDSQSFHIVGRPDPAPGRLFNSAFNIATAGYFSMMRIPIREGREFLDSDGASTPAVAVVNEAAARRFWPGESPLGRQIALPVAPGEPDLHGHDDAGARSRTVMLTIVGVCGDVHHTSLADPPRPEIFLDSMQAPLDWPWAVLAIRTTLDPKSLAEAVKAALAAVDSNVPFVRATTLEDIVARSIAEPHLLSSLFGAFALLAITLATIGLYGLISYSVLQRTHELGIRVALGASRGELMRLVLGQGLRLSALGLAIGMVGGLAATRALVGLFHGIEPNNPVTFAAVAAVVLACAMVASYLPARRAIRIDPIVALRSE